MSANSSTSISESPGRAASGRRFVLAALGGALVLLAVAAAANWVVDPFDKLGRNQIGIYNSSERDAKPQMLVRYPHDALIVGTSRMTFVDPTAIKDYRFFNAAFSEATPEEILDFLSLYAVDQRLVVLGLDFMMFNEVFLPLRANPFTAVAPANGGAPLASYADVKALRNYLLSWNVTWNTVKTLAQGLLDVNPPVLMPAGNRNAKQKLADDARVTVPDDSDAVEYWRTKTLRDFRYSQARIVALEQIKTLLGERHIPLIVLITPDNASFIALIHELGLYPTYLKFRADMRTIFPDAFDFSESRWSGIDYRFKSDPGHFLPATGLDMMTEILAGRGKLERNRAVK